MIRIVFVLLVIVSFFLLGIVFSSTVILPNVANRYQPTLTPIVTITPLPTVTLFPTATLIPTIEVTPTPSIIIKPPKDSVKLMPLGDSITYGDVVPGGYRTELWKKLVAIDGDRIDFVGSMSSGSPDLGDSDHEGHIGFETSQLVGPVSGWIASYQPDIVLLNAGVNDVIHGVPVDLAVQRLSSLIGNIFAAQSETYVIVSSLVASRNINKEAWLALNAAIPGIAANYRSKGYKIVALDMSYALTESDFLDGIHPNKQGYDKMAAMWYPVVTTIYKEYASTYNLK